MDFLGGKFNYNSPTNGYYQGPIGAPYYQGYKGVLDHPEFMRVQLARESLFRIKEGANRVTFAKILLGYVMQNGGFVATDVRPTWGLQVEPTGRYYLASGTKATPKKQGGTSIGTGVAKGSFFMKDLQEVKALQVKDMIALPAIRTTLNKNEDSKTVKYSVSNGKAIYHSDGIWVAPEIAEITEVNYDTGEIKVKRMLTNDTASGVKLGMTFGVVAPTITNGAEEIPEPNTILDRDAFFMKIGNSMGELDDDQLIYSMSPNYDYNYVQRIIRKWGASDMEGKIVKNYNYATGRGEPAGNSQNATFNNNMKTTIEDFWEQVNWIHLLGGRKSEMSADKKYRGYVGGLLETINSNQIVELKEPDYNSFNTKPGSFTIPVINNILKDKFYFGEQTKWLICGSRMVGAWATMFNYMTQQIPDIVDTWRVEGKSFKCSNGGTINIVVDDTLTLNGLDDIGILWSPGSYQHGYLGEDAKIIAELPQTNPHVKQGEIFIDITSKRVNHNANWIFKLDPNS